MLDTTALPGAELVAQGLRDLESGRETVASLVVSVASWRLRVLGFRVPPLHARVESVELLLHELVQREPGTLDAFARYQALLEELDSFLEAAESRRRRAAKRAG